MPGIEVGDIGPKLGFNGVDNGFLRFTYVRVPRDAMLMRFAKVRAGREGVPRGRWVGSRWEVWATPAGLLAAGTAACWPEGWVCKLLERLVFCPPLALALADPSPFCLCAAPRPSHSPAPTPPPP